MVSDSPRLRRLLLAYTVNELGTWFGYIALAVGVYDDTRSAIATAGLFIARALLPALLAPIVVVRLERPSSRQALPWLYLIEGALTLGLAALVWRFWLPGVLMLVAIDGVAAVAATALVRATAANLSTSMGGEAAQRRTNAHLNMAFMFAFAAGPALGGMIVHAIGGPIALLIDACTFISCAPLLLNVTAPDIESLQGSTKARLKAAWRHIQEVRSLRALLLTQSVAIVFFTSVEPVEVIYAKATLAAGNLGLGALLGVWGLGAALGAIVFSRIAQRSLGPILTLGTLLVGVAYLGFAAAPTLSYACAAALVGGIGNGIQGPAALSAVQRLTPPQLQGRMMSAIGSISTLCPAIGFALGGVIVALSSTRVAMVTAGAVATLVTGAFLRLSAGNASLESEPIDEPVQVSTN